MKRARRSGFTLFQLLIVLAVLAILLGLLLPAVAKVRQAAARAQSSNNLKQMSLALHNYADSQPRPMFPSGLDANGFSAITKLLPYVEQDQLYKTIDLNKPFDDKANAEARKAQLKLLQSPLDPVTVVKDGWGATSYLFNDLAFPARANAAFPASFTDGTSNTILTAETLKGDGGTRAVTVQRQIVLLDKDALKDLKEDAGVKYFKDGKNVSGDRCASWMNGHFLQTTFNGRLRPNDERPDVSCAGEGGVSAIRMPGSVVLVGMADGSVRSVSAKISHETWKAAITPAGGEVLGADW
jgi:type II secretory pathway pseudopilin PulG